MADGHSGQRRYYVAFALVAVLVLSILLALPLSLDSILDDLLGSADGAVAPLVAGEGRAARRHGTAGTS